MSSSNTSSSSSAAATSSAAYNANLASSGSWWQRTFAEDSVWPLLLLCFVAISRILGAEHSPLQWDESSFNLAAYDYDISQDRPHLPGYPLHILLLRLFRLVLSPFAANVAPSVLWSCLGAILLFQLLRRWLQASKAGAFSLFILSIPSLWYHGSVSEIYAFDFFFSLLVVRLGLSTTAIRALPIVMALGAGVRQSSAVFLLPLYCWFWYAQINDKKVSLRTCIQAHLIGLLVLSAWLIPFLSLCGGLGEYLHMYHLYPPGAVNSPSVNILSMLQLSLYFGSTSTILLLLSLFPLFHDKTTQSDPQNSAPKPIMLILWVVIPMLAFCFTTFTKGYILLCLAGLMFALVNKVRKLQPRLLYSLALFNAIFYLFFPYKEPNMSIWLAPRWNISRQYKAIERCTTVFAQTQGRITALNSIMIEADSCLHTIPDSSLVFVEPSYALSARAMQSRFADKGFVIALLSENNSALIMQGLSQKIDRRMDTLFNHVYLLASPQFASLRKDLKVIRSTEHSVLAELPEDRSARHQLYRWMYQLYVKDDSL